MVRWRTGDPMTPYGIAYTAQSTTITLPVGAFWVLSIIALAGLYLIVTGARDWIGAAVAKGGRVWT